MENSKRPASFSSSRHKLKPRVIETDAADLVQMAPLSPGQNLPLVLTPLVEGTDLVAWCARHEALLQDKLTRHGALLFRHFGLKGQDAFLEYLDRQPYPMMKYLESSTPRSVVGHNVYTSTEYPPEHTIALHNELSTALSFPLKVWFYCHIAPTHGGATPLADSRRVLNRIDAAVVREFRAKGWRLTRNYAHGLGLTWQEAFKTREQSEVEAYCRTQSIDFRWESADHLRTVQTRPAVIEHPRSGEQAWFNHMAFWHVANLDPAARRELENQFGADGLPFQTFFGDGSAIPDAVANHIRDAYLQEKVIFPWQTGDLLLLDNILTCHGREPYCGERRILVAMGEVFERSDIPAGITTP